jgi:hypothetical protein
MTIDSMTVNSMTINSMTLSIDECEALDNRPNGADTVA